MEYKLTFLVALAVLGGLSLMVTFQLGNSQTIGEENDSAVAGTNNESNSSAVMNNNTIVLNAAEVGEKQYRWVDNSGTENPSLNLTANNEYTVKISNPTDEEHELVIDSQGGKKSEIAKSDEIKPKDNIEFTFKTDKPGELSYHCKYHPDMMNGTITVSPSS
jgi:plastocyanin